jgi:hypothetical protein
MISTIGVEQNKVQNVCRVHFFHLTNLYESKQKLSANPTIVILCMHVRSEVITAGSTNIGLLGDVTPWSLVARYQHFGGTCCLHFQGSCYEFLRQYATSRRVAGSSPDEMNIFNLPNPSSRTMALGSIQPLTEMSSRNLPGKKRAADA